MAGYEITESLIPIGGASSRPGTQLAGGKPAKIVVHYTGNPGSTAINTRNWFAAGNASASSHYVIGLQGEIIQCIPDNEIAWHAGKSYNAKYNATVAQNNKTMLGVEVCHPDATGKYNSDAYAALIWLLARLCHTHELNPETDIIRHYDCTGKVCPLYYVNNPDAWEALKAAAIDEYNADAKDGADEPPAAASDTPSTWAQAAWDWGRTAGICDGTRPTAAATREEVVAMLANYRRTQTS